LYRAAHGNRSFLVIAVARFPDQAWGQGDTLMVPVQRIGHATYETSNLDRQVDYYTEVVGFAVADRTPERAILCTRIGEEVLVLERGEVARCARLSFQLAPDLTLNEVAAGLQQHNIRSQRRGSITPAIERAVVFDDPKGTEIELFSANIPPSTGLRVNGIAPMKLGHVAHIVPDAKLVTDFYVETLGFRVSDWMEDFFSFLRCGPDHHTVNFRTGDRTFMHHIAFELKDWAHLQIACETLGMHKRPILWGPLRHGIGHNIAIYHRDPDDHIIEFYTEMDQMKNEELGYFEPRPWHGDRPQRPKVWDRASGAMVWGTPPAPDYLRSRPPLPQR
jgi:catechol 2,3-dioxygenase-like lactoylglutathione lyase family enzyme